MANTKTGHRCKQQPQQRKFNPLAGTCVDGLRNQFCGYFKETKMQLIMEFPKQQTTNGTSRGQCFGSSDSRAERRQRGV